MNDEKLKSLLNGLADITVEPVNPALGADIKRHIPARLHRRGGLDGVNIIINLRISKLAAAATIIITLIACAALLGGRDRNSKGILQEIRYSFATDSTGRNQLLAGLSGLYERMLGEGKQVTYYGKYVGSDDKNMILMHWRLDNGNYNVIFGDFRLKTVTAEELINLQTQMLNGKDK